MCASSPMAPRPSSACGRLFVLVTGEVDPLHSHPSPAVAARRVVPRGAQQREPTAGRRQAQALGRTSVDADVPRACSLCGACCRARSWRPAAAGGDAPAPAAVDARLPPTPRAQAESGSHRGIHDPPRSRDHAGEPLVRLLLRHVPGRRRDPRRGRALHRLPARSAGRGLRVSVPRPTQVNGGAQHDADSARRTWTAAPWTDSWHGGTARRPRVRRPAPVCESSAPPDVMGYHDAREIPNYWRWAHDFTLQDHMFEPTASWSLPAHLFLVSGWSAHCTRGGDPQAASTTTS